MQTNSSDVFIGNFDESVSVLPRKSVSVETVKAAGSAGESVSTATKAGAAIGFIVVIVGFALGFSMAGVFLKFS